MALILEAAGAITDWDDAYANAPHIPGGDAYPDAWARDAAAFRATARQRDGIFLPEGEPRGLVVFVHGGYWMKFDPSFWSHLAAGPLARGWAVAMPGYRLAPEARIAAMTRQIARGIAAAAAAVPGPVVLTGHSAGGHLVARMVCADSPLPAEVRPRIDRCVPISGLFDLRPLMLTDMNRTLRLDLAEARAESPALLEPAVRVPVRPWVGADERPEFLRQTRLLANIWSGLAADIRAAEAGGRHHFDVIAELTEPGSDLTEAVVGDRSYSRSRQRFTSG